MSVGKLRLFSHPSLLSEPTTLLYTAQCSNSVPVVLQCKLESGCQPLGFKETEIVLCVFDLALQTNCR